MAVNPFQIVRYLLIPIRYPDEKTWRLVSPLTTNKPPHRVRSAVYKQDISSVQSAKRSTTEGGQLTGSSPRTLPPFFLFAWLLLFRCCLFVGWLHDDQKSETRQSGTPPCKRGVGVLAFILPIAGHCSGCSLPTYVKFCGNAQSPVNPPTSPGSVALLVAPAHSCFSVACTCGPNPVLPAGPTQVCSPLVVDMRVIYTRSSACVCVCGCCLVVCLGSTRRDICPLWIGTVDCVIPAAYV
ncbi:hypothetical protein B0T22DRAFT_460615 [Podospora appendiculata]|uniref:Uncharacterized protein n=1 Tax=Podospora appendiculata TaxID=314037 RepID=A0AAE0XAM8_9PEZI|nr:hypothetical protein B0T22DRAFT_460615 [Podospora appendiculata]